MRSGTEAGLMEIHLAAAPAIEQRAKRSGDSWEALFPTIMMGDDRAVREVWVGGERVAER